MSGSPAPRVSPVVVRVLQVSAMLMFVLSILAFNDKLPFGTTAETRKILGPALCVVGLLDLGVATLMGRRAR